MNPWAYLPDSYFPPLRGDIYSITWRADLGPGTSPGAIARYLDAFHSALGIGERWGTVMAEEAAARSLLAEIFATSVDNEPSLEAMRGEIPPGDDKRVYLAIAQLLAARGGDHPELNVEVPAVLRKIASCSVPKLLGGAPRTVEVRYQNPIEIIILGSGFALYGAVQLLRIARDWKARRRQADAGATIAEHTARQAIARTRVIEYLSDEIVAGRVQVPASQLGAMLTREDLTAVAELAGPEPTLELPAGVADSLGDDSAK